MLYNAVGPDISEMNSVYAEATSCEEKPLENDYGNLNHKVCCERELCMCQSYLTRLTAESDVDFCFIGIRIL